MPGLEGIGLVASSHWPQVWDSALRHIGLDLPSQKVPCGRREERQHQRVDWNVRQRPHTGRKHAPPGVAQQQAVFCRSSLDAVSTRPHENTGSGKAEGGQGQVQLDDGPDPETAQRRCALHDGQVAMVVCDVDEMAAGSKARGEEDGLAEGGLEALGKAGQDLRIGRMRVQRVEEQGEDW